jgi:tetratricopeptide (TPR) repeat protein
MLVLRYWRIGLGAAIALGALGASVAAAADPAVPTFPECTKKASKDDNEAAKNAHRVATQFYDRGDYDKAIRYWNDAFSFDCSVNDLLINIANAYEKKGDLPGTVATLEAYLKRTGPNPTVEAKVSNLKLRLAPPAPPVTSAPTASAAPTVVEVTPPPTATTTVPPPVTEGVRPYGKAPWGLVGGGSALVVVGAILLPVGYGGYNSANSLCPSHMKCVQSTVDQGNTGRLESQIGWALLGTGVAAAAGGLIWQLALNKPGPLPPAATTTKARRTARPDVWVTPAGGPGQSGVVVGGAF